MNPELRVTAYWYAATHGLPCDLDYLKDLGYHAARVAAWQGMQPWRVPEGPYWVHTWPEWLWTRCAEDLFWIEWLRTPMPEGEAARDIVTGNGNYGPYG